MSISHFVFHIKAPVAAVFRALTDPKMIAQWRVPEGMTSEVHHFEAKLNGKFRVSLTYQDPTQTGKSAQHTDTYHGFFEQFTLDEQIVEVIEFETNDPAMKGEMILTTRLVENDGGTDLFAIPEGLDRKIIKKAGSSLLRNSLPSLKNLNRVLNDLRERAERQGVLRFAQRI